MAQHPLRCTSGIYTTEEIERSSYGNQYAAIEVGLEQRHKYLLLGSAQGNPYDIGAVVVEHRTNRGIVELFYLAERKFVKCHLLHSWVHLYKILLQCVKCALIGAKKRHAVFLFAYNILEDIASAILFVSFAVNQAQIEWHITAVTNGKHAIIDYFLIGCVAIDSIEYHAVGHTNIVSSAAGYLVGNSIVGSCRIRILY